MIYVVHLVCIYIYDMVYIICINMYGTSGNRYMIHMATVHRYFVHFLDAQYD